MAAAVDSEHTRNVLECSICLQKLANPKILTCTHQFCKECLEGILVFREDGSAIIACPLDKCAHQTVINVNQTVNDLTTYELEDIVEAVKPEEERLIAQIPICTYVDSCMNVISLYCCGQQMCKSCCVNHDNTQLQHQGRVNVFFCKKENKLKGLCEEHFSPFTHLCCDNVFLCIYCLHRNQQHKEHVKNTIETEVGLIKEALIDDFNNMEKIEECRKTTEANIPIMKEKLDTVLQARRDECLAQYVAYLNAEEEKIKSKFEDICDNVRLLSELSLYEDGL